MRPSLRFLMLAVIGWAGFRATTLGMIPAGLLTERSEARPVPPIVATEFPPITPAEPAAPIDYATPSPAALVANAAASSVRYVREMIGVPVPVRTASASYAAFPPPIPASYPDIPPRVSRLAYARQGSDPVYYGAVPPADEWPLSRLAAMSSPLVRSSVAPIQSTPVLADSRARRLQISSWALLRGQQGQPLGPTSLASGGQLGGSQAGARLTYMISRQIAASFRTSSDVGRRGGEFAAGVRVQPIQSIPVWITAERRQRLGSLGGGRNAFAIFAEGGLYQRPLPWQFALDAYLQGGVVGLKSRDLFIDGGLAVTRPLFGKLAAGFGVWGAAQPGLYRVDAGPRLTVKVRKNVRVHLDYRQKLAGNAQPGSGPALTMGVDF